MFVLIVIVFYWFVNIDYVDSFPSLKADSIIVTFGAYNNVNIPTFFTHRIFLVGSELIKQILVHVHTYTFEFLFN